MLTILAMPPFGIGLMGWINFIPLFFICIYKPKQSLSAGFLYGLFLGIYFFYGASSYSLLLWFLVSLILAGLLAISFYFITFIFHHVKSLIFKAFSVASTAVLMNTCCGLLNLPFDWSLLLTQSLQSLQILSLGGTSLLTFILFFFQTLLFFVLNDFLNTVRLNHSISQTLLTTLQQNKLIFVFIASLFIGVQGFGWSQLNLNKPEITQQNSTKLTVASIQSNLTPEQYSHIQLDKTLENLSQHRQQLFNQLKSYGKIDLTVWPEIEFAGFEFHHLQTFFQQNHNNLMPMLVVSPNIDSAGHVQKTSFSISSQGKILHQHIKTQLVPLVETGIQKGKKTTIHQCLKSKPIHFICLESTQINQLSSLKVEQADIISISANDAFAGPSFLPYFHAEFAKLWAIQYQKPVIRSANAGISMILNHHGEVISKLDLFKQGILVNQVIINSQNNSTPKHHWVIWISLMISGLTLIYFLFNKIGIIPIKIISLKSILLFFCWLVLLVTFQHHFIQQLYQKNSNNPILRPFSKQFTLEKSQVKDIQTSKITETAFASVAYLLRKYGLNESLNSIKQLSTDYSIEEIITKKGFKANLLDHRQHHEKRIYTPGLSRFKSGEMVVLISIDDNSVLYYSPLSGTEKTVSKQQFLANWQKQLLWISAKPILQAQSCQ
ncbi:MAG: hypothetical protein HON94_03760 [Methylococcales bacterium]|nr:hypothetical protein [Methylococcales bacterium]MBT7408687.1 hypothetical protein [Methylococcales bacterium]